MESNEPIKVHFVGAGPGAPDLITIRGANLLKASQVVIYAGSLVNPELLEYAQDAEIFNSALMTLDEIVETIRVKYGEGKEIVRLHTGDPSLYGAIREQMDELDRLGIRYDSCPGVSACFGAAAVLDLEYTLPNVSQSLIVTRMSGKTPVPESESIESLAAHRASMAVYLSAGMLDELAKRLIAGGYRPETPAAIVYKATWRDEIKLVCTIAELAETARAENIRKTAVVLVGEAVAASDYARSRLYAPDFSTEFRKAKE